MNGYELCKSILTHPKGGVPALLEIAGNTECEWLELKASVQLTPEDAKKGDKPEDLYWSIANAVISMMNSYGGAVIIGIEDKNHNRVPFEESDPNGFIRKGGIEAYLRCAIYDKIWADNGGMKNWGTKNNFHSKVPLPNIVHIESYNYHGGPVAVLLVEPAIPCLRIWKGQVEEIRIRPLGNIGKTKEIIGSDAMQAYEQNERRKDVSQPHFENIYSNFIDQKDQDGKKRREMQRILLIIAAILTLAFFAFFILPILWAPKPVPPIPGIKTPDQIIVKHPHFTIEWYVLNHHNWWVTSDRVDTCYGPWEMQRNKMFGNFRIVDPRNITRCWGSQEEVIPIFNELREKLEKECPPQKIPVPK